ncbi:MAG: hypothetical protein K2M51_03775, partial [Helicobacter sp.]|nr:hypothetical protein [Helicobacter sp.]
SNPLHSTKSFLLFLAFQLFLLSLSRSNCSLWNLLAILSEFARKGFGICMRFSIARCCGCDSCDCEVLGYNGAKERRCSSDYV